VDVVLVVITIIPHFEGFCDIFIATLQTIFTCNPLTFKGFPLLLVAVLGYLELLKGGCHLG